MSHIIKQMIDEVWSFPRGTKLEPGGRKNPDNFRHYRKWGFTIYRTCYGKESEKHWQALLYSLRHQTKLAFGAFEDEEETDQDDMRRVQELFHLDVRENPSNLDGLDVRRLRDFCNAEKLKETEVKASTKYRVSTRPHGGRAMANYVFKFVLLADEAVLTDIGKGEFVVKAISLSLDGNSGWGWMRIPTGYLLELWIFLMWNKHRTESCLRCHGPEVDLEESIWPGDMALLDTGRCSEIRDWPYYSGQKDDMW
ncbi:uncharacterized protein FTJAE_10128 [Fusarium tjaetaba]|uniref:Uncharacterized protein n=1 Tax=Fusarium tjaetaba TaxID=1567544 RepID=A0A8H5VHD3_9HYPO|nr:uncharacterized protein FTJAE_10128 [Fusarium tjaetaba]KAF5624782.1 hypothetical protein FTJAE_10128 [Fusarium tjaetaba]